MAGECGLDPTHLPPPGALVTTCDDHVTPSGLGRMIAEEMDDSRQGSLFACFFASKMLKNAQTISTSVI